MAESNFVDYVKIYCRSGKGGRGSAHMRRAKYVPMADRTVETAAVGVMFTFAATATIGRCSICVMTGMSLPAMAGMAPKPGRRARTARTSI